MIRRALPAPLTDFVAAMDAIIGLPEAELLNEGAKQLKALIARGSWLSPEYREPDADHYRQYLLYCDPSERYVIASFVWGPGQSTPIHNHTVWGLVGVLEGAEIEQAYWKQDGGLSPYGNARLLKAGCVSPISVDADIHRVSNAYDDRVSISIHVYGGNIGKIRRSTFDAAGEAKSFISGFANAPVSPLEHEE